MIVGTAGHIDHGKTALLKTLTGQAGDLRQEERERGMTIEKTTVHVMRHGEVFNPTGVLYGRLPGFHLSERGRAMARSVAAHLRR